MREREEREESQPRAGRRGTTATRRRKTTHAAALLGDGRLLGLAEEGGEGGEGALVGAGLLELGGVLDHGGRGLLVRLGEVLVERRDVLDGGDDLQAVHRSVSAWLR